VAHAVHTLELTYSLTAQVAAHEEADPGVFPAEMYVPAAHAMQPSPAVPVVYSLASQVAAQAVTAPVESSPRALYVLEAHAMQAPSLATYWFTAHFIALAS